MLPRGTPRRRRYVCPTRLSYQISRSFASSGRSGFQTVFDVSSCFLAESRECSVSCGYSFTAVFSHDCAEKRYKQAIFRHFSAQKRVMLILFTNIAGEKSPRCAGTHRGLEKELSCGYLMCVRFSGDAQTPLQTCELPQKSPFGSRNARDGMLVIGHRRQIARKPHLIGIIDAVIDGEGCV